ncbi:MAG: hypothetical protein GXP45_03490 [bacterium]|nr:hypothetical protein [bacterium]
MKSLLQTREIDDLEESSQKIAMASLKFSMLLPDTQKKIVFDVDDVVSFEGETGPYLQYAFVRAKAILKQVVLEEPFDVSLLSQKEEKQLLIQLSLFEELVQKSAVEYKPHLIARWALDIAKLFNNYYHQHKIL